MEKLKWQRSGPGPEGDLGGFQFVPFTGFGEVRVRSGTASRDMHGYSEEQVHFCDATHVCVAFLLQFLAWEVTDMPKCKESSQTHGNASKQEASELQTRARCQCYPWLVR